jgi:hypothetical protein
MALFGWLPLIIMVALHHHQWSAGASMWIFFAVLAIGGIATL